MSRRIFVLSIGLAAFLLACDLSVLPELFLGSATPSPTVVALVPPALVPGFTATPVPAAPPAPPQPGPSATPATQPGAVPPANNPTLPNANATPTAPRTPTPGIAARKIAYSVCDKLCDQPEHASVWIVNIDGSGAYKAMDRALHPSFAPDGNKFAFEDAAEGVYTANSDGGNKFKVSNDSGAS